MIFFSPFSPEMSSPAFLLLKITHNRVIFISKGGFMKGFTVSTTFIDYPSDDDDAIIVYFYGCEHNCEGCHSKDNQNFIEYDYKDVINEIKKLNYFKTYDKIVLSGGDPLFPKHEKQTNMLIKELLSMGFLICIYTGYPINIVKKKLLYEVDFIKSGVYIKSMSQESGKWDWGMSLASKNQNFFDGKFNQLSTDGKLYWRKNGK